MYMNAVIGIDKMFCWIILHTFQFLILKGNLFALFTTRYNIFVSMHSVHSSCFDKQEYVNLNQLTYM